MSGQAGHSPEVQNFRRAVLALGTLSVLFLLGKIAATDWTRLGPLAMGTGFVSVVWLVWVSRWGSSARLRAWQEFCQRWLDRFNGPQRWGYRLGLVLTLALLGSLLQMLGKLWLLGLLLGLPLLLGLDQARLAKPRHYWQHLIWPTLTLLVALVVEGVWGWSFLILGGLGLVSVLVLAEQARQESVGLAQSVGRFATRRRLLRAGLISLALSGLGWQGLSPLAQLDRPWQPDRPPNSEADQQQEPPTEPSSSDGESSSSDTEPSSQQAGGTTSAEAASAPPQSEDSGPGQAETGPGPADSPASEAGSPPFPWLWLLLGLLVGSLAALWVWRRRSGARAGAQLALLPTEGLDAVSTHYWQARLGVEGPGLRTDSSRSPGQFLRDVQQQQPEAATDWQGLTQLYLEARFSGQPLRPEQVQLAQRLSQRLSQYRSVNAAKA